MLAEAYCNEAFNLDVNGEYTAPCESVRQANSRIHEAILYNAPDVASIVRQARKELQPIVF
jgi:hypothetical protein